MKAMFILVALLFSPWVNAIDSPELFKINSYNKVIDQNKQPFLMVMWSLECPPCIKELHMLGDLYKHYPDIKLVFVSTDSILRTNEINQLINESGLQDFASWVFSDDSIQSLRYNIDPGWYGELPRSYFHETTSNKRYAVSGLLDSKKLLSWFKRVQNS